MRKINNKGFGLVEGMLIVVAILILVFGGYYVWNENHKDTEPTVKTSSSDNVETSNSKTAENKLTTFTLENEGLSFDYNKEISVIKSDEPVANVPNGTFTQTLEVVTGKATLGIIAGIDTIGGMGPCTGNRDECKVIDTLESSYLGEPITYRLVEAHQISACGYGSLPSCDEAPLVTSFFIDTHNVGEEIYGSCCGIINADARNLGGKAEVPGALLINIAPDDSIQGPNMLKNKDVLETIKIIESMHY